MDEKFDAVNTPADVRSLLLFTPLNGDDPEGLRKRIMAGFEVETVKQNPKRKVYRLRCNDGSELYLKLFAPQNILVSCLRFYAWREYLSARRLDNAGLPVIRYLAWGRLHRGGFCVSEGIPQALPARRYFFETLRHDPELLSVFLEQLSNVTAQLLRQRIRHPDFHLGNILFSGKLQRLFLADPWGVRPLPFLWKKHKIELCLPWLEMSGSVPEEPLLNAMAETGLASSAGEAGKLLSEALSEHAFRIRHHRDKLNARILSGKSKFATEIELPEGRCAFRHTEWFEPPEELVISPLWHRHAFDSEAESRQIWLDSFLRIPPLENPPLARLITNDGASILFYAEEER